MALTDKQIRFCEEYIVSLNATQSAIKAGYSENTAAEIGYENLRKPHIREFIDKKLSEMALSSTETAKLITDIAKGSLNDYFVVKKVEKRPRIEVGLSEIIKSIQDEIEFETEYSSLVNLQDDELKRHLEHQEQRKKEIIRLGLELRKNPFATRIIDGPAEWVEVAELDMVKLVADKERGRIKSIAPGQYGLKVEMYAADAALRDVAKIHGLFEKDNEQSKPPASTTTIIWGDGKAITI